MSKERKIETEVQEKKSPTLEQKEQLKKLQSDLKKIQWKKNMCQANYVLGDLLIAAGVIATAKLRTDSITGSHAPEYEVEKTTLKDGKLSSEITGYKALPSSSLHYESAWYPQDAEHSYRYVVDTTYQEEIERFLEHYNAENNVNLEMINLSIALNNKDVTVNQKPNDEIDITEEPILEIHCETLHKEHMRPAQVSLFERTSLFILALIGMGIIGWDVKVRFFGRMKDSTFIAESKSKIKELKQQIRTLKKDE